MLTGVDSVNAHPPLSGELIFVTARSLIASDNLISSNVYPSSLSTSGAGELAEVLPSCAIFFFYVAVTD